MDFDPSALLGTGALLAVIISVIAWIVGLLVFYLVTKAAVAHGLRSHQLWMEKHRPDHAGRHHPAPTPPE